MKSANLLSIVKPVAFSSSTKPWKRVETFKIKDSSVKIARSIENTYLRAEKAELREFTSHLYDVTDHFNSLLNEFLYEIVGW